MLLSVIYNIDDNNNGGYLMQLPRWHKVNRTRKCNISYKDPMYVKYYDLDSTDFEYLVSKLQNNQRLTEDENNRYGIYILTICLIVQEHKQFKMKPLWEREEMLDQMYYELLCAITGFNSAKGKIYSYAYRIGYTAACHYFTNKIDDKKKRDAIEEHCKEELESYLYEYSSHKTERH